MHAAPQGMGREGMRPKAGEVSDGGKGPRRPKDHSRLRRGHKIKKYTKRLKRSR